MKIDVKIPSVGESVTEATVCSWNKKNGDYVKRNEVLLLVETDKASVEVVAENDGVLEIKTEAGQVVPIGAVVATLDTAAAKPATVQASTTSTASTTSSASVASPAAPMAAATTVGSAGGGMPMSPAVQRIVNEKNLEPSSITGTGKGGRLTKEDVLKAEVSVATAPVQTSQNAPTSKPAAWNPPTVQGSKQGLVERAPMSTIRRRIAEKLVEAQHTAAILTTFNEIDMSKAMELRNKYKDKFKEKYGVNLGFMGFFTRAVIEALKAFPAVNASIEGHEIVYKKFYNIGVAVGTEKGLIVPVIKDADLLNIAGVENAIKYFATKARDNKITVDDLSGGSFTISNGGVYGSLMSTPILNYPQVGILGMHKIEERPVAINGKVEIRPMMYVALSYDHRIIDGKEAVGFLVKVKEGVEDPERLLLEI